MHLVEVHLSNLVQNQYFVHQVLCSWWLKPWNFQNGSNSPHSNMSASLEQIPITRGLVEWSFRGSMAVKSMVKDVLIGYGNYWLSWFSSQCELVPQPVIFFLLHKVGCGLTMWWCVIHSGFRTKTLYRRLMEGFLKLQVEIVWLRIDGYEHVNGL